MLLERQDFTIPKDYEKKKLLRQFHLKVNKKLEIKKSKVKSKVKAKAFGKGSGLYVLRIREFPDPILWRLGFLGLG